MSGGAVMEEQAAPAGGNSSGRARYVACCLVGYSLGFIVFGSQVSILGPTIAPLAERLGVSEPDLSPLFTALGVACIVSGPPSGWLVDRLPTHRVLLASLLVQAAGFALVPFMPSIPALTALYFLICFSYNFTNSAVFTSLGWMFPPGQAGAALNLVLAMFGVGSFFIPLAAQACKALLGSALHVFSLVAATSVAAAIPFLVVPSPAAPAPLPVPTPPPPPSAPAPALMANGDHAAGDKASRAAADADNVAALRWAAQTTTAATVLLVFFTTAAETAMGNWLYTYGVREAGLSDESAALGNSAFWGAFTVGRIIGAALSAHGVVGHPATLLLACTPLAVAGAALPLLLTPGAGTCSPWHLVLATAALTGLGNSTGYANAVALFSRYVPVTGFMNGVFGMVAGAACMVGPTTVALLVKYTGLGYTAMAWVGLAFYALHFPAILTVLAAGRRLAQLRGAMQEAQEEQQEQDVDVEEGDANEEAAGREDAEGLTQPLLVPRASSAAAAQQLQAQHQNHQHQHQPVRLTRAGSEGYYGGGGGGLSSSWQQAHYNQQLLCSSVPGHAVSPIATTAGSVGAGGGAGIHWGG